jgi:hypothetical protein
VIQPNPNPTVSQSPLSSNPSQMSTLLQAQEQSAQQAQQQNPQIS